MRHLPSPSSVWEPSPASAWASAPRPRPSASARLRLRRRLASDGLDLDLGQRAPEAVLPPVAGPLTVLADPHLLAAQVLDDLRRHLRVFGRDPNVALAADEQHRRMEGL